MSDLPDLDANIDQLAAFLRDRFDEDEEDIESEANCAPWTAERQLHDLALKREVVRICSMEDGQFGALLWFAQLYTYHPHFNPVWYIDPADYPAAAERSGGRSDGGAQIFDLNQGVDHRRLDRGVTE